MIFACLCVREGEGLNILTAKGPLYLDLIWLEDGKGMEKWDDRKVGKKRDYSFYHLCLVRGGKVGNAKHFCLLKKKNERIKSVICINLLLCPCYIIYNI